MLNFFLLSVSMCATFNTLRCFIINILLSLYHASDIKHRWRTNANGMIADSKVKKAMPIFLFISKTKTDVRKQLSARDPFGMVKCLICAHNFNRSCKHIIHHHCTVRDFVLSEVRNKISKRNTIFLVS